MRLLFLVHYAMFLIRLSDVVGFFAGLVIGLGAAIHRVSVRLAQKATRVAATFDKP